MKQKVQSQYTRSLKAIIVVAAMLTAVACGERTSPTPPAAPASPQSAAQAADAVAVKDGLETIKEGKTVYKRDDTDPTTPLAGGVVRGTASYRERIAMLPGALFEATLLDVSRQDAPAETLASTRVEDPGKLPIQFELRYDRARIDERHSYVVRASIANGDRLMFTTDTAYPVLTRGNGSEVEMLLVRVPASGGRPGSQ